MESVRPELLLTGWTRRQEGRGNPAREVIAFQSVRNVGRGAALHVHVNAFQEMANRPTAILTTIQIPILPAGETHEVNGEIVVWWKNVPPAEGSVKDLAITIDILCWDSRNMRHETRYRLAAAESPENTIMIGAVAPGVMLGARTTHIRSVRMLKVARQVERIRSAVRRGLSDVL